MELIKNLLKQRPNNIDNKINSYIDNRFGFIPRNESEKAALDVATKLHDLEAINFHLKVVSEVGSHKARELCSLTLEDIDIADKKGSPINNPAALYNWKIQNFKKQT